MERVIVASTMTQKNLPFVKLQGFGNDFVLLDSMRGPFPRLNRSLIQAIGDRKTGVGFDQLLMLKKHKKAHALLEIFNTDGSRAEMCGNGLRAAALYLWNQPGFQKVPVLRVQTDNGLLQARLVRWLDASRKSAQIECEMGQFKVLPTPKLLHVGVAPVVVNVGNPHAVFVLPQSVSLSATLVHAVGPKVETHKAFPQRTNVEFIQIQGKSTLKAMVWERGVGWTEACGSGAVACAVASGLKSKAIKVCFPGGTATVMLNRKTHKALLIGQATWVFSGQLFL